MRNKEISVEKPKDLMRIAAMGDSVTLGFGVEDDQTWAYRLEKRLEENGKKVQVLNFGVGGLNIHQEFILLNLKAAQFKPDLIVWEYTLNDPYIDSLNPVHIRYKKLPIFLRHTRRLIDVAVMMTKFRVWGHNDSTRYWYNTACKPWKEAVKTLGKLKQYADENHIPIVFAIAPVPPLDAAGKPWLLDVYRQIENETKDKFDLVNLRDSLKKYSDKEVFLDPVHLTVFGNEQVAEILEQKPYIDNYAPH
jgi:lysophospholipase L1-like esterase